MSTKGILTPGQCRAARGFLDWTQEELAERAAVSRGTIRDFEKGRHALHRSTETLLTAAFTTAGLRLVPREEGGPGVLCPAECPASGANDAAA
ncbi:helix-turn-helix transcriptional regulator [Azospirillum sp. TSO35-2]|uniref:helix-turn-helix transcriptional regulator n=1 Tax=Azospirillum sp. TSO35-2 TaxID=716796 RepID=UPI000D6065E5|nr:helix-turn-helix transcriptional regulator [Azospirillum sp. TSO35-2]PWC33166.1 transcriptional regulator [Azospirillum sp. TSO35-2]